MTPEHRRRISEATRKALASPEMRLKISERTKAAMAAKAAWAPELAMLQGAWRIAGPEARRRFLDDLFSGLISDAR